MNTDLLKIAALTAYTMIYHSSADSAAYNIDQSLRDGYGIFDLIDETITAIASNDITEIIDALEIEIEFNTDSNNIAYLSGCIAALHYYHFTGEYMEFRPVH